MTVKSCLRVAQKRLLILHCCFPNYSLYYSKH